MNDCWVVCSIEQPKKNGNYLITIKNTVKDKTDYFTDFRFYNSRKKKWDVGIERDNPGMSIHAWRYLPEPYGGEDDE